ncbi:MAG: virulence factor SrfB [Hyphomicrobiaceae bacterium]
MKALSEAGVSEPQDLMHSMFGSGDPASASATHLALRLRHNILMPAAMALLQLDAAAGGFSSAQGQRTATLAELVEIGCGRMASLAGQFDQVVAAAGARDFELASVTVALRPRQLRRLSEAHFDGLLDLVCDVVRAHNCHLLLLTGENAHLSRARALLLRRLPLAPHRIVAVDDRRLAVLERDGDRLADGIARRRLLPLLGMVLAGRDGLGRIALGEATARPRMSAAAGDVAPTTLGPSNDLTQPAPPRRVESTHEHAAPQPMGGMS